MFTDLSLLLQAEFLATPLGRVLIALVGIAVLIVVLRFVLSIAWRLVTVAAVLVGAFFLLSTFGVL